MAPAPAVGRVPAPDGVPRIAVATSGGLDSSALLHCTARLAAPAGIEVHALHVHHGLMAAADDWSRLVAAQCRRWSRDGRRIVFHAHRVASAPGRGDSVEAWARRERYAALASMAKESGCRIVLLAHHRRDQAETVLLQALRGAGPAGLAAMPAVVERQSLTWVRPWLDQPREAICAYARRWRLRVASDPSNGDDALARARLRTRLWPQLLDAFPAAETALLQVARRAHEARAIVDEVARADVARCADVHGLRVADWLELGAERRSSVLRHWLASVLDGPVPESLVRRLCRELPDARAARWPAGAHELQLHWDLLRRATPVVPFAPVAPAVRTIDLSRPGEHRLAPWPGSIVVEVAALGGVPAACLADAELRPRCGGEQFQAHAHAPPRRLKKQFQDQGVAAWARDGPLVFAGGALVFVPGLGTDARALQRAGHPRVQLRWRA